MTDPTGRPVRLDRATHLVDGRPARSWSGGTLGELPHVVFLPGLGAPGYLFPWARATAAWTRATVLDLPGWRWGRATACAPTLTGVADGVTAWLHALAPGPVVLVGHSTGAQAVIRAVLADPGSVQGVVLAGPTFAPPARRLPTLVRRALTTLPRERPAELPAVLPSYLHSGGRPLWRFLRDGMTDRPEEAVPGLLPPVLVLTGRHDGFAPPDWGAELATAAGAPHVVLPGAHNFCFPHAGTASAVLRQAVAGWTTPTSPDGADPGAGQPNVIR